jgi:hypothetical protein
VHKINDVGASNHGGENKLLFISEFPFLTKGFVRGRVDVYALAWPRFFTNQMCVTIFLPFPNKGFHAVEDRHYITDIHATVMHQLGIDARKLEVPGRKRLDIDYGRPIKEIIAVCDN